MKLYLFVVVEYGKERWCILSTVRPRAQHTVSRDLSPSLALDSVSADRFVLNRKICINYMFVAEIDGWDGGLGSKAEQCLSKQIMVTGKQCIRLKHLKQWCRHHEMKNKPYS